MSPIASETNYLLRSAVVARYQSATRFSDRLFSHIDKQDRYNHVNKIISITTDQRVASAEFTESTAFGSSGIQCELDEARQLGWPSKYRADSMPLSPRASFIIDREWPSITGQSVTTPEIIIKIYSNKCCHLKKKFKKIGVKTFSAISSF